MARFSTFFRSRPSVILASAVGALALVFALVQAGIVGASQDTVITLVPSGNAVAGELVTVKVVARNTHDLAGFQGTVQYDAANLRLTGASVDPALGRGGRGVLPLGPVMNDGSVALGAATCPTSDCGSGTAISRRVETGISGQVDLGTLEFIGATSGSYTLDLANVQFVDPQGNALDVRVEPLTLTITSR